MQKVVNALQFNPEESFPRSSRICKSYEFNTLYAGKRVSGSMFIIHYKHMGSGSKAGIVVSKKVSKSAVKRNTLKRRLREIFRRNRDILPSDISILIRGLPKAAGADFNEIKREVIWLFSLITSKESGSNVDKVL